MNPYRAAAAVFLAGVSIVPRLRGEERPAAPASPIDVQWGGFLQVQGEAGDSGDSRFDGGDRIYLRRARLNATATFPEHFRAKLELELAGSLSKTSSLRAQVTDGYIEWVGWPALSVRAGQFKTPFGFEQLYADTRLATIERSLGNDRLTAGRQLGFDVFGSVGMLDYSAGFFNGSGTNNNFNDNGNFLSAGRLSATLGKGVCERLGEWALAVGVDGLSSRDESIALASDFGLDSTPATSARDDLFAGRRRAYGADGQLRAGPFELWAEYLRETLEPRDALPAATVRADGWYAEATWFAVPRRLQVVAKYDTFDPNRDAHSADTRTWTAGLNYFVRGDHLKLQIDYLRTRLPFGSIQNKALGRVQAVF
jgi:phosphate-selective porin OprO and OprP